MEILLEDGESRESPSPPEEKARQKLFLFLERLGIKRDAIESRPYLELLAELLPDNAGAE